MKKHLAITASSAAVLLLTGCVQSPTPALIQHDLQIPGEVVSNEVQPIKEGRSECRTVLGLASSGDCSVETAKLAGGIVKVHSVDYLVNDYFVYGTYTTIVKGE